MFNEAPPWFLQLLAFSGVGYFLWSIRQVLVDFKGEVSELKELIGKLFDNDQNYERRLSFLEGQCKSNHRSIAPRTQPSALSTQD